MLRRRHNQHIFLKDKRDSKVYVGVGKHRKSKNMIKERKETDSRKKIRIKTDEGNDRNWYE